MLRSYGLYIFIRFTYEILKKKEILDLVVLRFQQLEIPENNSDQRDIYAYNYRDGKEFKYSCLSLRVIYVRVIREALIRRK